MASRDVSRVTGFGGVRAYGAYDDLIADGDVDAVYIATPHPLHARWAIACAQAGKHVLCEKPLGINLAEAEAIVDAAQRNGVFLMEAFMYRCHPQTALLVELMRSHAVGDIRVIEAVHSFRGPNDPTGRLLSNELGGGGILDVGCYCVSGARLVASAALGVDAAEPVDVFGAGHIGETGVDEWAVATLRFDGDIVANLSTGIRLDQPARLAVYGTEGLIVLRAPWLPTVHGDAEIVLRRPGRDPEILRPDVDRGLYAYEADAVAHAVGAGLTQALFPACTWADTLASMRTLDRWRAAVGVHYHADTLPSPVHARPLRRGDMPTVDVRGLDKQVSRIALGTMVADGPATLARALGIFDAYAEAGGNTFDTAHIYANGESEDALGRWLTTRGIRDEMVVIAKGAHTPDCSPDKIRPQLEESLERMRTPYADLYFLHRDDPDIPVGEFVDALETLRHEGLIRAYGGSNWTARRIDEANAWARDNAAAGFTSLSNQFSLAQMIAPTYPGVVGMNDAAFRGWVAEREMTNFAWSSQSSGFFSGLEPDGFLAHAWFSDDNLERRRRTAELASSLGVQSVTVALAWILHTGLPVVPIIGPLTLAELRTSLQALDVQLTGEQVRWLEVST